MNRLHYAKKVMDHAMGPACVRWESCDFNYNGSEITVKYDYCEGEIEIQDILINRTGGWMEYLEQWFIDELARKCKEREECQL